jgi:hypothetical protein
MTISFIDNPEYTVYETQHSTYDPIKGLKVGHPVAHYTDRKQMIADWFNEFKDGTHNFFVAQAEA